MGNRLEVRDIPVPSAGCVAIRLDALLARLEHRAHLFPLSEDTGRLIGHGSRVHTMVRRKGPHDLVLALDQPARLLDPPERHRQDDQLLVRLGGLLPVAVLIEQLHRLERHLVCALELERLQRGVALGTGGGRPKGNVATRAGELHRLARLFRAGVRPEHLRDPHLGPRSVARVLRREDVGDPPVDRRVLGNVGNIPTRKDVA